MNEFQVALGETTCSSIFPPVSGMLNIVDLGQIALERATSALSAITIMGALAEKYGYRDAGDSADLIPCPHADPNPGLNILALQFFWA